MTKKKRKVCVVVTARSSYSRIRSALVGIREHQSLELQLIVSGSAVLKRYGQVSDMMVADGFHITASLFNTLEGENLVTSAKSTGLALIELTALFENLGPDLVVSIADRHETIATAIAAAYLNIPLVHVQGGEITGSIDEKVRHAITKLADVHLVSSESAKRRVERLGEIPNRVIVTGCPSIDLAAKLDLDEPPNFDVVKRYGGVGAALNISDGFVVVLQHPVTTHHAQSRQHAWALLESVEALGMPTIWMWPNADAGADGTSNAIRKFREERPAKNFRFFKHIDSLDFLRLLSKCSCVVGNSSVGIRECAFLGVPVVNLGDRQAGRDRGVNVLDVEEFNSEKIINAVKEQMRHGKYPTDLIYGDGKAGVRIAESIASCDLAVEKRLPF